MQAESALGRVGWVLLLTIAHAVIAGLLVLAGRAMPADLLTYTAYFRADADLFLYDLNRAQRFNLTRNPTYEGGGYWSPDGRQITYSAHPADQPENNDIVVRGPDQASTPIVVARSEANEIYPVFSPDGRYIAYASNQTGYYDIFILDRETNTTYQLTSTVEEDYPGSWAP